MIKKITTIFFGIFSLASLLVFAAPEKADAQAAADCDIISAEFRTTRPLNSVFYIDGAAPYVYIDLETQNCIGESIGISIAENDPGADTGINGTNGINDPCNNNYNGCMNNRSIPITANEVTLSLRAGEDSCDPVTPNCEYYLITWDEVMSGQSWSTGIQLNYDCDGGCNEYWVYEGLLQNAGGTNQLDPDYLPDDDGGGPLGDGPGDGGGPLGDEQDNGSTIDLGLTNPLAGTIDTLPQLFQKVVEIIIKIGVPLVAMAILWAGFLFVWARGNSEQINKAKKALLFALIGGIVLLAAWLIADAIRDALMTIND